MLVFRDAICFAKMQPNLFSAFCIQSDHLPDGSRLAISHVAVHQLKVEVPVIKNWSGRHSKLDVEFSVLVLKALFPDQITVNGIANQFAIAHHRPNMFSVGTGRRTGRVSCVARIFVDAVEVFLPANFAVCPNAHQNECFVFNAGDKNI